MRTQRFCPFTVDLPDNYLASYKTELARWSWKWQNVDDMPTTLIENLQHGKFDLYSNCDV
jgi:hypothetical protein